MHFEEEELVPEFVDYVNSNEAEVLAREFRYLGGRIVEHARERLKHPEYFPKRFLYVKNLGLIGGPADAALLEPFLSDKGEYVRHAVQEALDRIRSRDS